MSPPIMGEKGQRRARAVHAYNLSDPYVQAILRGLAVLARETLDVPIASVFLVHPEQRWVRFHQGLRPEAIPAADALCAEIVRRAGTPVVVEDAAADPHFRDYLIVTKEPHVRFVIGVPVMSPLGDVIGAVCACDTSPRSVQPEKVEALGLVADQVAAQLELARMRGSGAPPPTRSELETMLSVAEQYQNSFLATFPEGIIIHDDTGAVRYANKGAQDLLGLDLDQLMGVVAVDPRWNLLDERGEPLAPDQIPSEATARDGRGRRNVILGVQRGDGARTWLSVSTASLGPGGGGRCAVIASLTGVNELKLARRDLAAANKRLEAMFETARDGVVSVDSEGRIERVNLAAAHMFGYEPAELIGVDARALLPEGTSAFADLRRAGFLRSGASTEGGEAEVAMRHRDGSLIPVDVSVGSSRAGDSVMWTAFLRDARERKRVALQVSEAEFRLRTSIAYDLHDSTGQLLAGGRFLAQGLLDDQPDALRPRMARVVDVLSEALGHVRTVSRGLLAFDSSGGSLIDALRAIAQKTTERYGIKCHAVAEPDCPEPSLDEKRHVFLVVEEAVANAVRHSGCTNIGVSFGCRDAHYELVVRDDGRGIPLPRPKSGLGLTTMEHRARLLGGSLRVHTPEGAGTFITVQWPTPRAEAIP